MYKPNQYATQPKEMQIKLLREEISDLQADALFAEQQAMNGPYYPDKGITEAALWIHATNQWNAVGQKMAALMQIEEEDHAPQ